MVLSRCGLIGYGSWATALCGVLQNNGVHVFWHVPNHAILDGLLTEGRNIKYISDLLLDGSLMTPVADIDVVVRNCDVILVAVPSAYLSGVFSTLHESLADKFVVSATKGIIPDAGLRTTEYLNRFCNVPYENLGVLSGPSHAEEVAHEEFTCLTLACNDIARSREIGRMFENDYISIVHSDDVCGIEFSGILKNIYAVAVGIADGLGYRDNSKAMLVSACARELSRFIDAACPCDRNAMDVVYLGDLLVTCYSTLSRNHMLGALIGGGMTVSEALDSMVMVAEGYTASTSFHAISTSMNVEMPISDFVFSVLHSGQDPDLGMKALFRTF